MLNYTMKMGTWEARKNDGWGCQLWHVLARKSWGSGPGYDFIGAYREDESYSTILVGF